VIGNEDTEMGLVWGMHLQGRCRLSMGEAIEMSAVAGL
jgi:hypothetical protein